MSGGSVQLHSRPIAFAIFDNEKIVQPRAALSRPWADVVGLLGIRQHRPQKSGPMLGGYALTGRRNNAGVAYRSFIQLDIDSDVVRDAQTGQVLSVGARAPALIDIQPKISQFEWVASSSHSHEPAIGVIKYRLTMLPDRDIQPDEHEPVLEALDDLLGGCLDRKAWPLSQAFYLPSCPIENAGGAFAVHNAGEALKVDEFVARGRAIMSARAGLPPQAAPIVRVRRPPLAEDQANLDMVNAMLASVPASNAYDLWRDVVWAIRSLGWTCGEHIARIWSMSCPQKWDPVSFASVWGSYDPNRPDAIDLGALERLAQARGYSGALSPHPSQFDGRGADLANGKRFAEMQRDHLLNIHETGEWLLFDPTIGWANAPPLEADRAAKAVVAHLRQDAAQQFADAVGEDRVKRLVRHVEYSSRATSIRAMIDMARSEPGITRRAVDFDADPDLLGLRNGVLDLNHGRLLRVSPSVLVSLRCNVGYDPDATCPAFDKFLAEVQPDPVMQSFLQRLAGYCLTGHATEQKFAFLFGSGANGKSVLIELIAWLLGDYARRIQTEMLMQQQRSSQAPSPDIVGLKGVRFAYANETEEGRRLADARVKALTGGDTLVGRVPYGKAEISFRPTHKLVLAGNHKPDIGDMSDGMWRRVLLIGFDVTVPESSRNPHLLDDLKVEGPGILNWALTGHKQWRRIGLRAPPKVDQETAAYREEQDILADWIADRCVVGVTLTVSKSELYADYHMWTRANGHCPQGSSRLTRRLKERGFIVQPDKRTIAGLRLKVNGLAGNL